MDGINNNVISTIRKGELRAAQTLLTMALGAVDTDRIELADTLVVTVQRVLETYEAVTQLTPGGISTIDENAAIGLHLARGRDA